MKKRILALFSLLLCACLLASCTIREGPNYFWLAGETVRFSPAPTVSDFPPVFPDLYYKSEENAAANIEMPLCSNPSHFPYYEMSVGRSERLADAEIGYFLMIGGNPGNMDVWGITFDMTKEEVEVKFREIEQKRGLTGVITDYIGEEDGYNEDGGYSSAGYIAQVFQRLNIERDSMTYTQYLVAHSDMFIAYRNNRVYGILLFFFDPWSDRIE